MNGARIKALLVEDDADDALLIGQMLAEAVGIRFDVQRVERLADGLKLLRDVQFDVVILDLSLPDAQGLSTLGRTRTQAPDVPIVVLSGLDDHALAVRAVASGAQDYLLKDQVTSDLLARSIRYAIERQRLENALQQAEHWERQSWARLQAARDYRYYSAMSRDGLLDAVEDEGDAPLREELAAQYRDLVIGYVQSDRALEVRPQRRLHELAGRLAQTGARTRDVMRLHLEVLRELEHLAGPEEYPQVLTDVRLVLLDLMGSLLDAYRDKCAGDDPSTEDSHGEGRDQGPAG